MLEKTCREYVFFSMSLECFQRQAGPENPKDKLGIYSPICDGRLVYMSSPSFGVRLGVQKVSNNNTAESL